MLRTLRLAPRLLTSHQQYGIGGPLSFAHRQLGTEAPGVVEVHSDQEYERHLKAANGRHTSPAPVRGPFSGFGDFDRGGWCKQMQASWLWWTSPPSGVGPVSPPLFQPALHAILFTARKLRGAAMQARSWRPCTLSWRRCTLACAHSPTSFLHAGCLIKHERRMLPAGEVPEG